MEKEINLTEVVKYLSRAFFKASTNASRVIGKNAQRFKNKNHVWETTPLYDYQVKFCYMLDDIKRGPRYLVKERILRANKFIADLEAIGDE